MLMVFTVFFMMVFLVGTTYATQIRMMTGSPGGIWYPTGSAITEFLEADIDGLSVTVSPGGGVSNVEAIRQGIAQIGFTKSPTAADALMGRDPFEVEVENVSNLMFLMEEHVQIIVPQASPIECIEDFKGKTVITSERGSSGEIILRQILEVYGITYDDLGSVHFVTFSDAVTLMKDRQADAWVLSTSIPASTVLDLSSARDIRLLSIEDPERLESLVEMNPAFIPNEVPAGAYDFMDEPITAIATALHLIISRDLSEDLVYEITASIDRNLDVVREVHPNYQILTGELIASEVGVPFHPGALKYYQEAGYID